MIVDSLMQMHICITILQWINSSPLDNTEIIAIYYLSVACPIEGFNTLRPRQNDRHFRYDIFKCTFLNENEWIALKVSLKFVRKGQIDNIPSLLQIMAWRRPGDKPLSEAMMISLLMHICVTRLQWVKQDIHHSKCIKLLSVINDMMKSISVDL